MFRVEKDARFFLWLYLYFMTVVGTGIASGIYTLTRSLGWSVAGFLTTLVIPLFLGVIFYRLLERLEESKIGQKTPGISIMVLTAIAILGIIALVAGPYLLPLLIK